MGKKYTVNYHPSPSKLTSRVHPLIFLWTPRRFIFPEYFSKSFSNLHIYPTNHGCRKQASQRGGRGKGGAGGHGPPLFLKPYFARNIFLEICFCVILQGIQNFFLAPAFPKSCQGPWKSFKFMVLRLLKETFMSRKIESFHFCSFPQVKRSPRQGNYPFHQNSIF